MILYIPTIADIEYINIDINFAYNDVKISCQQYDTKTRYLKITLTNKGNLITLNSSTMSAVVNYCDPNLKPMLKGLAEINNEEKHTNLVNRITR